VAAPKVTVAYQPPQCDGFQEKAFIEITTGNLKEAAGRHQVIMPQNLSWLWPDEVAVVDSQVGRTNQSFPRRLGYKSRYHLDTRRTLAVGMVSGKLSQTTATIYQRRKKGRNL
jgi:hypothetical protein